MRKTDAELCINTHNKSGAVCSICQTGSAIYIWISNKLACIINYCLSGCTCRSCISLCFCRRFSGCFLSSCSCLFYCCSCFFLCIGLICFRNCFLCSFFCSLTLFCFFLQSCLLFCGRLCRNKICSHYNIISRNITIACLCSYFNPTRIRFINCYQIFAFRKHIDNL